jgi:hypothetical protein
MEFLFQQAMSRTAPKEAWAAEGGTLARVSLLAQACLNLSPE